MTTWPRTQWVRALTAVKEEKIKTVADALRQRYRVHPLMLPEAGLGLLKMQDSALHDHFYLGEFPVASAHLELIDDAGRTYPGGCHVMHDAADYAVDLAVCDAALAHSLPGCEMVRELLDEGIKIRRQEEKVRAKMRHSTRVDFNLLANVS